MTADAPLPALPGALTTGDGQLVCGRFVGDLATDPIAGGPRDGRVRRWLYAAGGDEHTLVGAAVVDLGFVGVAFAFAAVGGRTVTWQTRRPAALGLTVGRTPAAGAAASGRTTAVAVTADGALSVDVPTEHGRLRAEVHVTARSTPVVLATGTPEGGWNVTAKGAGTAVAGSVALGELGRTELGPTAGGWWDWTAGRQDRTTAWRWAAGAGIDASGRRVGINASTGMNGAEAGEDVAWIDGRPHPMAVDELAPVDDATDGPWRVRGPGTDLVLSPVGVRGAHDQVPFVTSSYVQPFGTWRGSVADAQGRPVEVALAGVAEDHLAVW